MAHDNMIKQIRMSLMIRHALRMMGVKVASNYRDINAIACAALVEGAMGLKRNSLARQMTVSGISRAFAKYGADRSGIDPEILDVGNSSGPVNGSTMKMLSKLVSEIRGSGFKGIEPDMFLYGLWDSGMLPGGGQDDYGFMQTNAKPFWYTLGKTYSARILGGNFTMRDFINLTRKKLQQYGLNFQNNANRRLQDQTDFDTYEDASSPVSSESIITEFFKALDTPSHDLHNRAKEWWVDNIESTVGGVQLAVLQAFRALGATDDMSIKGGYKGMRGGNASASAWIEDNLNMTVSVKAISKAWPKIKDSFGRKFQQGMSDSRYEDLWAGLQDKLDVGSAFSQNRGMQIQYDDSRMASIVKRHAYRQQLRLRKLASASTNEDILNHYGISKEAFSDDSIADRMKWERKLKKDIEKRLGAKDVHWDMIEDAVYAVCDEWHGILWSQVSNKDGYDFFANEKDIRKWVSGRGKLSRMKNYKSRRIVDRDEETYPDFIEYYTENYGEHLDHEPGTPTRMASTKTAGWTSSYEWQSKKDVVEYLKRGVVRSPLMVSNGRGGCAMLAKGSNGKKSIFVFLINKEGGEWGYKDMHESEGPGYYEVPLKMLKAADPPVNEMAQNWREKVRKAQGIRAIKWQPGDLCSVYGNKFEVVSKRKRGWLVMSLANGKLYSAMPRQMEPLR